MKTLTRRQTEVLELIRQTISLTGMPPTRAEIASQLGFRSANAAEDHLRALCRKGVIEMIPGASRGIRILSLEEPASEQPSGLPVVGSVAAGAPVLAIENIEQYCALSPDFFSPVADYLLKVEGDSMKNAGILNGDLIAVHRQNTADNGQIVVARIDNEVTVKRLEKQKNHILLHPENSDYEPIRVSANHEDFAIEGVYVGIIRR